MSVRFLAFLGCARRRYRGVGTGNAPGSAATQFKHGNERAKGKGRNAKKAALAVTPLLHDFRAAPPTAVR